MFRSEAEAGLRIACMKNLVKQATIRWARCCVRYAPYHPWGSQRQAGTRKMPEGEVEALGSVGGGLFFYYRSAFGKAGGTPWRAPIRLFWENRPKSV